jgi:hypothetical protein
VVQSFAHAGQTVRRHTSQLFDAPAARQCAQTTAPGPLAIKRYGTLTKVTLRVWAARMVPPLP